MNLSFGVLYTGYTGMKKTTVLKEVQVLPNSIDRIAGRRSAFRTKGEFISPFKVQIQM
jgi:hypothetical protein